MDMNSELDQDEESFKKYLSDELRLGHRTIKIYMFYYSHFNPLNLSSDYVYNFILKHKNNVAVRAFIKNYLNYQQIDMNNFRLPKSPSGRKIKRVYRDISKEDIRKMRYHFYKQSFKYGLVFELIYQGALRRFEILSIKLNSFDWNTWLDDIESFCRLKILGKGKKERVVLIDPETANKIVNYYIEKNSWNTIEEIKDGMNRDVLLFVKASGDQLIEQNVYYYIKTNSRKALKTRDVRPHELRAYRAIELEEKGTPINEIKEYLGHSKITTTALYLKKSKKRVIDNIEKRLID